MFEFQNNGVGVEVTPPNFLYMVFHPEDSAPGMAEVIFTVKKGPFESTETETTNPTPAEPDDSTDGTDSGT